MAKFLAFGYRNLAIQYSSFFETCKRCTCSSMYMRYSCFTMDSSIPSSSCTAYLESVYQLFEFDTCRETLCQYNDTKRSPIHRNLGASKWPKLIGVANFPIHFVLGISGACNKRHNNSQHMIDTSDFEPDLERAVYHD